MISLAKLKEGALNHSRDALQTAPSRRRAAPDGAVTADEIFVLKVIR